MMKFGTDKLYVTTLFVILGILRYMQITMVENRSGSPTEVLLRDGFLQLAILVACHLCSPDLRVSSMRMCPLRYTEPVESFLSCV